MGEVEKSSFIALPGKAGQSGLMPSRPGDTPPPPGGSREAFIVFRGQGRISSWKVRLVDIKVEFQVSSAFWFQPV